MPRSESDRPERIVGDSYTRPYEIDRRDLLKLTGGVVGGTALSTAASAETSNLFTLSYPSDVTVTPGEEVTFEFSLTKDSADPDPEDGPVTAHVVGIGFRICPNVVGTPGECAASAWDEYEIVEQSAPSERWTAESSTQGVWSWSAPDDITEGETRTFSVTVAVAEDATPGTHELTINHVDYASGPLIQPDPYHDAEAVSVTVEGPEFDATLGSSVGSVAQGESTTLFPVVTNTGDVAGNPAVYFRAATDETAHNADYYGTDFDVVAHDDDGGDWGFEGWSWSGVEPGESREPSVELEVGETVDPGEYTFAVESIGNGQFDEPDDTAITTVTVERDESVLEEYDDDGDGEIDASELNEGVKDYLQDDLSSSGLNELIRLYLRS